MGKEGAPRGSELQRGRGLPRPALWLIAIALAACSTPQTEPPRNVASPPPVEPAEPAEPVEPTTGEDVGEAVAEADAPGDNDDGDDGDDGDAPGDGDGDGEDEDGDGAPPGDGDDEQAAKPLPDPPAIPAPDDVAAPPRNARRLAKGLRYKVLARGKGKIRPKKTDNVTVHYTGWTTDGTMFDSSVVRGRPNTFRPDRLIEGWTIALTRMREGDKWRLWIPEDLAYKGREGPPKGMLVFDVELVGVEVTPPPPKAPRDVKRPPRNARKTASGVSYRFLGKRQPKATRPTADSTVVVHYSGWTTDGTLFDSSVTRGQPARFPLSGVIPGWRDAIVEMAVGERMRMWIPEELAYAGRAGAPQGMLVFDVELLEVID